MGNLKSDLEEGQTLSLQFAKRGGLLPVIVQNATNGQVLMLGYANEAALAETQRSGMATFWSTSRQTLWTKGKTSGDYLRLEEILTDCDQDALVYSVTPLGSGACHTKRATCFYRRLEGQQRLTFLPGLEAPPQPDSE